MRNSIKWLLAGVAALVVIVVGGTWLYVNVISGEAPAPLTAATADPPSTSGPDAAEEGTDGTWEVTGGSVVGYRVQEILFGQENTAVGRTETVTGSIEVQGTKVLRGSFEADVASLQSDQGRRDNTVRTRIMDTSQYPRATFGFTEPIDVGSVPPEGAERTYPAKGKLTLRGRTKDVTFDVEGTLNGGRIEVAGSIPVKFSEWGIPNPSFGPAQVGDDGILEFALVFTKGTPD